MRTSVDIPDALMRRVRAAMNRRGTTFRQLVEEGLRRVLDESGDADGFVLRDAQFDGEVGFAAGVGEREVRDALAAFNEGRLPTDRPIHNRGVGGKPPR